MLSPKVANTVLAFMWACAVMSLCLSIVDLNIPRIIGNIGNLLINLGITIVFRNGSTNKLAVVSFTLAPVFAAVSSAMYMMGAEYSKVSSELVTFAMAFFYMKLFYVKKEE